MSLLRMKWEEEDPLWCDLLWEGVFWKKIYKSLFIRSLKPVFAASSLEEANALFNEIERKVAKSLAIKILSKKSAFGLDLSKKLEEKGISPQTVLAVVSFCKSIGALNDEELIEAKINKELRKGKGLYYAKGKWQKSMGDRAGEVEWYSAERQQLEKESIIQLLQKKGKVWNVLDRKEKSALVLFLLRRGFRKEAIEEVLF